MAGKLTSLSLRLIFAKHYLYFFSEMINFKLTSKRKENTYRASNVKY